MIFSEDKVDKKCGILTERKGKGLKTDREMKKSLINLTEKKVKKESTSMRESFDLKSLTEKRTNFNAINLESLIPTLNL